jgi:nucleoside 2-deoxyribosyltransferase
MKLDIIGGSYYEVCKESDWDELYGSGFRACVALSKKGIDMHFHTFADKETAEILKLLCNQLNIKLSFNDIAKTFEFIYDHPIASPILFPSLFPITSSEPLSIKNASNVIYFDTLDGQANVSANRLVYDPQSPDKPNSFRNSGSSADELIIVLNHKEASLLAGSTELEVIQNYLFNVENVNAAIVKNGAAGAFLFEKNKEVQNIPCFMTDKVWSIGSGDIFTSYFGYNWMIQDKSLFDAAHSASLATAFYANSKTLPIPDTSKIDFLPFLPKSKKEKKVYLAGPFFTMADRWLINQFYNALISFGIPVFSPLHDVGIGNADEVVGKDLSGMEDCDLILGIVDGLDSGTLFEIGYAISKGKKVICFVEYENKKSLTMLEGTGCIFENDFATIIYKTFWILYKD